MLTAEQFKHLFPNCKDPEGWVNAMNEVFPEYEINTPQRIAAFIAQCGHESGGWRVFSENLNYSAKALNAVFGKYFVRAGRDAEEYHRQPEKIANVVYANRMGNGDTDSGDGWKFRGRGYIQLTGRDNYTRFAKSIDKGLKDAVEYVETVEGALESACWFWDTNKLNKYADEADVKKATKRINGGYNGLEDREHKFAKLMKLLTGEEAPKPKKSSSKSKGSTSVTLSVGDRGEEVKN